MPTALPSIVPAMNVLDVIQNATTAIQLIELAITVLKADTGVSAVTIPGVGQGVSSDNELVEVLFSLAEGLPSEAVVT